MTVFEWAVVSFIVLSILFHVWRGGARNPESTGALGHKVSGLARSVSAIDGRVGAVEKKIDKLESEGATAKDIANLERLLDEKLATVRGEIATHRELSQATNRNVQRIYDIMLERGLGGK